MPCGVLYRQLNEINKALGTIKRAGLGPGSEAYNQVFSLRGKILTQIGFKYPRSIISIVKLIGLSPGSITLWLDIEGGWRSEGRVKPGAPPIYRPLTDEEAISILKRDITDELHDRLFTPDDYIGE